MNPTNNNGEERHVVGARTRLSLVRAQECQALEMFQIAHVGVAVAHAPYEMVRPRLRGTYFLACFDGVGEILLDGRWQRCAAGTACLAPAHVPHSFRALRGKSWSFCWVRYAQPEKQQPLIGASAPVIARYDPAGLRAAIDGLRAEAAGEAEPPVLQHWVHLIQDYVLRFAEPWRTDDRLRRLWERVESDLGRHWTLAELAAIAHLSAEHLRRLCLRQLGRSPMHQVTYLRLRRAAELLENTPDTVESIANTVGYANPFTFSNTFKKWIGCRPSECRGHRFGSTR